MPKDYARTERIGEQIHRELADLIARGVKDPRVGMVTVSGVDVSSDLSHAKVWFTLLGDTSVTDSLDGLRHAAGFLRHELGKRMRIRIIPELHFHYDDTQARGAHLSALIDQAVAEDEAKHHDSQSDSARTK